MDSVASRLVSAERNAFQLEETKVLLPWFYIPSYWFLKCSLFWVCFVTTIFFLLIDVRHFWSVRNWRNTRLPPLPRKNKGGGEMNHEPCYERLTPSLSLLSITVYVFLCCWCFSVPWLACAATYGGSLLLSVNRVTWCCLTGCILYTLQFLQFRKKTAAAVPLLVWLREKLLLPSPFIYVSSSSSIIIIIKIMIILLIAIIIIGTKTSLFWSQVCIVEHKCSTNCADYKSKSDKLHQIRSYKMLDCGERGKLWYRKNTSQRGVESQEIQHKYAVEDGIEPSRHWWRARPLTTAPIYSLERDLTGHDDYRQIHLKN